MANAKLGTKAVGSIVKLKVNGAAKEFIVVHQGKPGSMYDESCNGTWLLMKDIYESRQWHSTNTNYLEYSTFLNLFESNIRDAIKQVKIPYRKNGGGGGADQSGANGLPALILPQDMEVDSSGNVTLPPPATHKTLVNGTVYEVMGGKCLVNGTVYNILKGRTLIGGTGYDINFEPDVSLTWYFNETIDITSQPDKFWGYSSGIAVSFVSGYYGFTYDHLIRDYDDTYGVRTLIYYRKVTETRELAYRNGWRGEVYRTITFDELPTGDLLTWLQANATPQ